MNHLAARTFVVIALMAISTGTASAAPAHATKAQATTRAQICWPWDVTCHTYADAGTPLWGLPSRYPGVVVLRWEPHAIRVQMYCWLDNQYARWFRVEDWDGNWGWMESWHVHNQVATPHC